MCLFILFKLIAKRQFLLLFVCFNIFNSGIFIQDSESQMLLVWTVNPTGMKLVFFLHTFVFLCLLKKPMKAPSSVEIDLLEILYRSQKVLRIKPAVSFLSYLGMSFCLLFLCGEREQFLFFKKYCQNYELKHGLGATDNLRKKLSKCQFYLFKSSYFLNDLE